MNYLMIILRKYFFIFQTNVNIRNKLCSFLELKCFTFLQPLPFITGKEDKSHLNIKNVASKKDFWENKYNFLKFTNGVYDLNDMLKTNNRISFVDPNSLFAYCFKNYCK